MAENNIPNPDPTILTTQYLRHEIGSMRETIEARLDAMDKANQILNLFVQKNPSDTEKAMMQLTLLNDEKFESSRRERDSLVKSIETQLVDLTTVFNNRLDAVTQVFTAKIEYVASGIQKQFDERDVRSIASAHASSTAVNAALQAQKEAAGAQNESNAAAITKSEVSTVKQIDGILALLASNTKAIDEKITAINGRLDRSEGNRSGSSGTIAMMIAVVAVVATVFGVGISFVSSHAAPTYSQHG